VRAVGPRLFVGCLIVTTAAACGSSASTIGPLTLEPPDGWLVVDRAPGTIKVANGTIGADTTRGDATAVFDVYVDSAQSLREFRAVLEENNVRSSEDEIEIDGYDAVAVAYRASAFAPSGETVFIPEWNVRIVYRAAFGDAEAAFSRHRPEFRDALDSITFEGRPPARL
jgi:hypothetical protein